MTGFGIGDQIIPLQHIWELSQSLLLQYSTRLDIVYNDSAFPVTGKYPRIYYWGDSA